MTASIRVTPTTAAPGELLNIDGAGWNPKGPKFTLSTTNAAGIEVGQTSNTNRVQQDGTFHVGIYAPPMVGPAKVTCYQGSTKVEAPITVATVVTPPPPPPPLAVDFHVSPTGNDASDGRTRATAWRTLGKVQSTAPAGSRIALWDGGIIDGAGLYDKHFHITTDIGVQAQIRGTGKFSLDLQRWNTGKGSILPGSGGQILVLPPAVIDERVAVNLTTPQEKAGSALGRCVQLVSMGLAGNANSGIDMDIAVQAGTDFGIYLKDVLRSFIRGDVTDAGEAFRMGGNLGLGDDRTTVTGIAHDNHRMVRNTAAIANDDYGAVGFSWVNVTGGRQGAGWEARECWALSFDYVSDGGAFEFYNASDVIVEAGTATRCEGGFETGGTADLGNPRNSVKGVSFTGDMGPGTLASGVLPRSPVILVRNLRDSVLDFSADVTRARVVLEVYPDSGPFGGSIERDVITGTIVQHAGVTPTSLRDVPASTSITVTLK